MEMSKAYFEATLQHLQSKGFSIEPAQDEHFDQDRLVFSRVRAVCVLDPQCQFAFEALSYADGHETFFLELLKIGRARSFSFPLDSWKYHPKRIEFKYRDDPETGLGLAITIDFD
jgi:hypothetical protein